MFNGLDFFKTASALAGHAAQRQAVVARNVANADTPGYAARDLPEFGEVYRGGRDGWHVAMRATRPGHLESARAHGSPAAEIAVLQGDASPNGNTVSVETEMIRASEVRQAHDLAIATYRSGLDLLRTALGRGR